MSVRTALLTAGVLATLTTASATHAQPFPATVEVRHAAARMVVVPEARRNVSIEIHGGDPRLPPLGIRIENGRTVVEGGLEHRIGGCGGYGVVFAWGEHRDSTMRVMVRGIGPLTLDRLPVITAHVPLDARVAVGEAVWGEVGRSERLDFANSGCGDWRVADVRGDLRLAQSGSGDVRAGSAGAVQIAISGSGDVSLNQVGPLDAAVSGSGDVKVVGVNGPVSARIVGSGDVTIQHGRAPNVAASIAGSGDFTFHGEAGALAAKIAGSGDVNVAHVSGPVSKSVAGSGDVNVGR